MFLISCQTPSKGPSGLDKIHKLDDAANFLMLISDGALKETCGLTSAQALSMLQPLHAMIDIESKQIITPITDDLLSTCIDSCHCGLYSDLTKDTKLKNNFYEKARSLPKAGLLQCATVASKWLCKDILLKDLKAETESGQKIAH